jgi:hypothetical protein
VTKTSIATWRRNGDGVTVRGGGRVIADSGGHLSHGYAIDENFRLIPREAKVSLLSGQEDHLGFVVEADELARVSATCLPFASQRVELAACCMNQRRSVPTRRLPDSSCVNATHARIWCICRASILPTHTVMR